MRRPIASPPAAGGACSRCRAGSPSTPIADYAATGVDLISIGRITNSAPVLDIGLDIGHATA